MMQDWELEKRYHPENFKDEVDEEQEAIEEFELELESKEDELE